MNMYIFPLPTVLLLDSGLELADRQTSSERLFGLFLSLLELQPIFLKPPHGCLILRTIPSAAWTPPNWPFLRATLLGRQKWAGGLYRSLSLTALQEFAGSWHFWGDTPRDHTHHSLIFSHSVPILGEIIFRACSATSASLSSVTSFWPRLPALSLHP